MPIDLLAAARQVAASASAGEGTPPVTEIGTARSLSSGGRLIGAGYGSTGLPGWNEFITDDLEKVPELRDRLASVRTYHTMRNDSQVQGLFLGSTLPIRRYNWYIEPNGAREEVVQKLSSDYGLPIRGQEDQPTGRSKGRFNWKDHLRHALLGILYGHMYFEQVGEIGDDGYWHLRKLGVRMPHTIQQILVDDDGGLAGIRQNVLRSISYPAANFQPLPAIPVEKLVAYTWEHEGGNWAGRSMLRGMFKNWLLKDTVLRVGAINIERAGGVPVMIGPKGASPEELAVLARMARQFRVGESAGGAIPNGSELILAKAAGGEDAVQFIKLMNEEMGRAWLMMFMVLGQTTSGSRNLGGAFIDVALNAHETMADWIVGIFNEHMVEDDVDWNWGPNEQAPLIGYTRKDDRQLAIADLVDMVELGLIQMDNELESWVREEYQMPRRNDSETPRPLLSSPSVQPTTAGGGTAAERAARAAGLDSPASSSASLDPDFVRDLVRRVAPEQADAFDRSLEEALEVA